MAARSLTFQVFATIPPRNRTVLPPPRAVSENSKMLAEALTYAGHGAPAVFARRQMCVVDVISGVEHWIREGAKLQGFKWGAFPEQMVTAALFSGSDAKWVKDPYARYLTVVRAWASSCPRIGHLGVMVQRIDLEFDEDGKEHYDRLGLLRGTVLPEDPLWPRRMVSARRILQREFPESGTYDLAVEGWE